MSTTTSGEAYARLADRYDGFYAPSFRIRFGGTSGQSTDYQFDENGPEVRETNGLVSGLSIESTLDGADRFSCSLVGVYDLASATFDETVWNQFAPGTAIRIEVGYASRLVPVLEGRVQSLSQEFPGSGLPTVEVSGFDRLHDLTRPRAPASLTRRDTHLHDVVDEILSTGNYGFEGPRRYVKPLDLDSPLEEIVKQDEQSDYEFLEDWAKRYNYELFVHLVPEGTRAGEIGDVTARGTSEARFNFRTPTDDADPALTLRYGESLRSFSVEVNEASQQSGVIVRHWDTGGQRREPIVGEYAEDENGRETAVDEDTAQEVSVPVESPEQADLAARAAFKRTQQTRVTGRGELVGLPTLRVGHVVRLERLSSQVNANYYVTSVTHRVDESGYTTSIGVRLAAGETIDIEPS
jgi:hypothetical protein